MEPDGFVAEGEVPGQNPDGTPNPQAQNWPELQWMLEDVPCDKAVATSWSPFQKFVDLPGGGRGAVPAPETARVLIRHGWKVMPYVYPAEHKGVTVASMLQYARHHTYEEAPGVFDPGEGWYTPEPVAGVYCGVHGCFTLESPNFNGIENCAGFSVWDAGEEF